MHVCAVSAKRTRSRRARRRRRSGPGRARRGRRRSRRSSPAHRGSSATRPRSRCRCGTSARSRFQNSFLLLFTLTKIGNTFLQILTTVRNCLTNLMQKLQKLSENYLPNVGANLAKHILFDRLMNLCLYEKEDNRKWHPK